MDDDTRADGIDEADVEAAIASLGGGSFRGRIERSSPCPKGEGAEWATADGIPAHELTRRSMDELTAEMQLLDGELALRGLITKVEADQYLGGFRSGISDYVAPEPRDLFHVYGPDRDDTQDWRRYYRYSWTDKNPSYSGTATADHRTGGLFNYQYSYNGYASALAGVGLLMVPQLTDCMLSIRPYVTWQSIVSLTYNSWPPDSDEESWASAVGHVGIFVESWARTGGAYFNDRDHWIDVWSYGGHNIYVKQQWAGDDATVSDGLSVELFAHGHRKYAIYVYSWVEVQAEGLGERRSFATADMTSNVPYVVVEEKPM